MTLFETLIFQIHGAMATIALNRPSARNAMNHQMVIELISCFDHLKTETSVRTVILSGTNGTFCAGGDLKEMSQMDQNMAHNFSAILDTMLKSINEAPQVVIAKIEGAALGGGFGLICVADIAIASTEAKLGLPEVRLGIVPAVISPYVIERVGFTRARELMLTGRRFDGIEAVDYGVIHEAVVPEALETRVQTLVDEIMQCSPHALAVCKQLLFKVKDSLPEHTVVYRAQLLNELQQSIEGQEGIRAFEEKRIPNWVVKRFN